jgi:hypothetical protein
MQTIGKFNRNGYLTLEVAPDAQGAAQNIRIPFGPTIEFDINRQAQASTQTASFRVHNLQQATRDVIYKDAFNSTQFRAIQFFAGYGTFTPMIFNGTIKTAYSEKEGPENFVTNIEAYDGGFPITNGYTSGWGVPSQAIPPGTSAAEVISHLGDSLPNISGKTIVGNFPSVNMRGEVVCGNTWGLIQTKSNNLATIVNGQVIALNHTEALAGNQIRDITKPISDPIPVINAESGLLSSPRRSGALVEFDMLFEPRILLFQAIQLISTTNPRFTGQYKVVGFRHHGVISASSDSDTKTTVSVLYGTNVLGTLPL